MMKPMTMRPVFIAVMPANGYVLQGMSLFSRV
jgi:hypothetical protein